MLDPEAIKGKFANNGPIIRRVVDAYRESWPGLLEQLNTNHAAGRGEDLGKAAHSLKGSLGYLAEASMVEKAANLERLAKGGELDRAGVLLREFEHELRQFDGLLVEFLDSLD